MRFEDLLKEYENLKFKIRRTHIKEQEVRELEGFPIATGVDGMPRAKQNTSAPEKLALKLTEILSERKCLEKQLLSVREQISRCIDKVTHCAAQEVIETKVFIPNCGWKYVSKKLCLSIRRVTQLYHEGVAEINKKFGDELWKKIMF